MLPLIGNQGQTSGICLSNSGRDIKWDAVSRFESESNAQSQASRLTLVA